MQANDDEMVNNAVEIKLHAKARAGQMLVEGKKAGQIAKQGDNKASRHDKPVMSEIGISPRESSDFQKLASVPIKVLEKAIVTVKQRDGVLTEAAVKRELPKPKPIVPYERNVPDISQFAMKVCTRIDSILTPAADKAVEERT